MCKRALVCVVSVLLFLPLCGCWNYRSLDQMDIVVGIAIDFDRDSNKYKVCYEVADLSDSSRDDGFKGKLVVSEGNTMFDAARNAKRKEADRLYFGSAYIVVVSQEVARIIGLTPIMDWFLRDGECRETMYVAVSQQDTARAILENKEDSRNIISVTIQDILMEDSQVTASSIHPRLYEVYNMINSPRDSTMLAALDKIKFEDMVSCELYGIAVFKGDKLAGFLTPDESKYALFVENKLKGGILTLSMAGMQTDDISLEIFENRTKSSYTYEQGKVKIRIETNTYVAIAENQGRFDILQEDFVKSVEAAAAQMIEKNILNLISKLQNEFHADTFGFGEMIYKQNLPLWKQLEASWEELYPTVEVEVFSKVHAFSSGFMR